MKNGRKVVIDQALCRKVELLVKGGASHAEVGQICGISPATVSRIRTAGFNAEQFMRNNDMRREAEQKKRLKALDEAIDYVREMSKKDNASEQSLRLDGQIAGQVEMDLKKPAEEHKEPGEMTDQAKMMRFIAGQVKLVLSALEEISGRLERAGGA